MINALELKNFKRHETLSLNFTEGLNVIRAANEAGKSTIYNAIGYAFWGSRALPLSLDETVTWGKPVSALEVKLLFTHVGQQFKIVRRKAGAELTSPGLIVSGQAEVTAFVEKLLGVSSAVGEATLMTSQGQLQSGLDSSAVALIEKLSNMSLIDSVMGKIQDTLPCGNTKLIESILSGYAELKRPEFSHMEEENAVALASVAVSDLSDLLNNQLFAIEREREPALKLEALMERIGKQTLRHDDLARRLDRAKREIKPLPEPLSGLTIFELEALKVEQQENSKKSKAYSLFVDLQVFGVTVASAEFDTRLQQLNDEFALTRKDKQGLATKHAVVKASGIYQDSCALCGLALKDVPEVVKVNLRVETELAQIQKQLDHLTYRETCITESLKAVQEVLAADRVTENLSKQCEEYVTLDKSVRPYEASWTSSLPVEFSTEDYAGLIRTRITAEKDRDRLVASVEEAEKLVKRLELELASLVVGEAPESASAQLEGFRKLHSDMQILKAKSNDAENARDMAIERLSSAKKLEARALEQHQKDLEAKLKAEASYEEMFFNNELIKKLRTARPIVARELWGMVLQGVSQVFSQIRGVQSVVTRSDDKFLIDGKLSAAYSGSTKDSLGLAIRIMLQKTFLGTVDFVLLDEPAAGADETREADMIASVTRAGYAQVLLVTHSEVADVFATNVITL